MAKDCVTNYCTISILVCNFHGYALWGFRPYSYVPIPQVSKSVISFCKVNLIALSLGACWLLFLAEIPWMMLICSISSSNRSRYLRTTEQCMKKDRSAKMANLFRWHFAYWGMFILEMSTCTSEMSCPQKGFLVQHQMIIYLPLFIILSPLTRYIIVPHQSAKIHIWFHSLLRMVLTKVLNLCI